MTRRGAVLGVTVLLGAALTVTGFALWWSRSLWGSAEARSTRATAAAVSVYTRHLDQLDSALAVLDTNARRGDSSRVHVAFLRARLSWKRVEWLAEHYTPLTAAALNGPAIAVPDEENPRILVQPTGLQVIEAMLLASTGPRVRYDSIAIQAEMARVNAKRLRERIRETPVAAPQLFEAARAEIARIVSLGIAGFDAPLTGSAIPEAAASISALGEALSGFDTHGHALHDQAVAVMRYLEAHTDFDAFDRYEFITRYANPLSRTLGELERDAGLTRLEYPRPWRTAATSIFDEEAFDPQAFAPPGARRSTPAVIALGERLFHEPRLSGAGDRSCATCHAPSAAFVDNRRYPALIEDRSSRHGTAVPQRNTPTLLNAGLQAAVLSDVRVAFLEDQVTAVVSNPREMGGDINRVAHVIQHDASYQLALHAAFGETPNDKSISRELRSAVAAYIRSLVRMDSRFDRAMRGDSTAMTQDERSGFNLFMGKARCGSCHFAPLFNGTRPPLYNDSEVEVLGVPGNSRAPWILDSDPGAGGADRAATHRGAFKTSTVRNAAVTAPYMHNGVFATLADVVDFYDHGGGIGLGLKVPNQTLPADSLHLTSPEKHDLIAFIGALTDTAMVRGGRWTPPRR